MRVCVVVLDGGKVRPNTKRNTYDSFGFLGMEMILADLHAAGIEPEYVTPEHLHRYDYGLWSITAPEDIPTFLRLAAAGRVRKGGCILIVGGAGCINITSIYEYIDIAVFGRGEGLIVDVLDAKDHESVWYKNRDSYIENTYIMRQAEFLSPMESACGCKRKCFFCQYTWTRRRVGENYNAALRHGPRHNINEEDISALTISSPGRYTTAFDGISEESRFRVNKRFVTNNLITQKFASMIDVSAAHGKVVMLKVFNIVGYPWETVESVNAALEILSDVLLSACVGRVSGRVMAAIHSTPFSPEPLTPMELLPANVDINWRKAFGGKCKALVNNDMMNVFLGPYTNTPPTLAKRVLVNRCSLADRDKVVRILSSAKLDGQRGEAIRRSVTDYLQRDVFGQQDNPPVPYIRTYTDVSAIGRRMFEGRVE